MKTSLMESDKELKQTICELERTLWAKVIECAKKVYVKLLEQIDALIKRYRPKDLRIEHKRSTWYKTWLGPIRVNRRQYRDQEGNYHYLLDELLGMEKYNHITTKVQKTALDLAGNMTFRRSAEILSKTTGIDLSHQTIHRILKKVADKYLEKADKETAWFQQTGELPQVDGKKVDRLMIEADGVMLSLQREKSRKTEVKLGISYEGWTKIGKDRYSTLNKTVYADIADSDKFWAVMTLKLHKQYDLSNIKQTVVGGDGARWIKEGAEYFGGAYQLCRYHLNRELCYALCHDKETLKLVQHNFNRGEFDVALKLLTEAANVSKADKAPDIKRVIRYISSNASGLKDYREHADQHDNNLRRTGSIEGNVDKLIVRRMKNQGMSWTRQGIRRMLWLRIKLREGKLADYLPAHEKKFTTLHVASIKRINRVIERTLKRDYINYFSAGLPALSGPHASRPWAEMLKSLSGLAS